MLLAGDTTEATGCLLIVDDHAPTLGLLTAMLRGAFPGLCLLTARTAIEAVAICRASAPRLVVMDIGLPDTNGIETVRVIKTLSPAWPW